MNKSKGQVLVAFIILVPVIIMLLALVVDLGLLYVDKRKTSNEIKDVINYGLNNLDMDKTVIKDEMTRLININLKDIDKLIINIDEDSINIEILQTKKSIFSNVYNKASYQIKVKYSGELKDSKITIKEES